MSNAMLNTNTALLGNNRERERGRNIGRERHREREREKGGRIIYLYNRREHASNAKFKPSR